MINLETQYPGKVTPSSAEYPSGAARNVTIPGDGTGTPWEAAIANDLVGWKQALLQEAGVVASGSPENATASQIVQSLQRLAAMPWSASTNYELGARVIGSDGHAYKAVAATTSGDPKNPVGDGQEHWIPEQRTVYSNVGGGGANESPNVINGHPDNSIAAGTTVRANTISGGGLTGNLQRIDGPETRYATIGGGYDNYIDGVSSTDGLDGAASTIGGGAHHLLQCSHATIGGGSYAVIAPGCDYGFAGGGTGNVIRDESTHCTIGGGFGNTITNTNSSFSTIGGGTGNNIGGANSTIAGGSGNSTGTGTIANTVCGGVNNTADGGNATVLGGTTNSASAQGAIAWGRNATASARGALCFSSDDGGGDYAIDNNVVGRAVWRFSAGQYFMGANITTVPHSGDGGMQELIVETTTAVTASGSIDVSAAIPTNSYIIGVQLRVNSALGQNFDVAYTGQKTQSIATGLSSAQNTRVNSWFDISLENPVTSGGSTFVTITRNGGGNFTAQGEVYVQVRYKRFLNTQPV